jgi:hypothetical protein
MQWDVLACAALCAAGAALGVLTVLREMRYHALSPARCPTDALAALCVGVILGLWIPRRVIRQRLARGPVDAGHTSPGDLTEPHPLRLEFAASLTGALVLALALACVVLCAGAMWTEEYRAFLVGRFAYPPWLTRLLLLGPAWAGLVVTGAVGITLLVALNGWYRLVTQPHTRIARLWASTLFGTLAAGVLATQISSRAALAGLAPLIVFLAGVVAVLRRSDAVGMSTTTTTRHWPTRDELLLLLTAGLTAALVAGALVLALPPEGIASGQLTLGVVALAGAAAGGLMVGRLISRLRLNTEVAPLLLLAASIALLSPYQQLSVASVQVALVRLVLVTGCAAACIVLIGQRVEQTRHSIQCSLSWVGRAVAIGLGVTLLLLPIGTARWNPSAGALFVSLIATIGAGLTLMLSQRVRPATRVIGVTCVILWLVGMPVARRALARTSSPPAPAAPSAPAHPLATAARQLLTADSFQTAYVRPLPPTAMGATVWQFDLSGPALDLIVLESVSAADQQPCAGEEWEGRLLKRLSSRLAQGGRLLVELPTAPGVVEALDHFDPGPHCDDWVGHRLQMSSETDQYEAIVLGPDIPALIARNRRTSELRVALQPLRSALDFQH